MSGIAGWYKSGRHFDIMDDIYLYIKGFNLDDLAKLVNERIKLGYTPLGAPIWVDDRILSGWHQFMVKE